MAWIESASVLNGSSAGWHKMQLAGSALSLSVACLVCACTSDAPEATQDQRTASGAISSKAISSDGAPRIRTKQVEDQADRPLKQIDNMDVRELRNFMAGKQFRPGGPAGGREVFEANSTWKAYRQAVMPTFSEGFWEVRLGSYGRPELCTTETRRNRAMLSESQTVCRKISVSLRESRAELDTSWLPKTNYFVNISKIEE